MNRKLPTVSEMAEKCGFETVTGGNAIEKEVKCGYCGDLLSWVMGRAAQGCAWVTVMGNVNAVAVAVLTEASCIVLAENAELDEKAAAKAIENRVAVLKSGEGAFETVMKIGGMLNNGL